MEPPLLCTFRVFAPNAYDADAEGDGDEEDEVDGYESAESVALAFPHQRSRDEADRIPWLVEPSAVLALGADGAVGGTTTSDVVVKTESVEEEGSMFDHGPYSVVPVVTESEGVLGVLGNHLRSLSQPSTHNRYYAHPTRPVHPIGVDAYTAYNVENVTLPPVDGRIGGDSGSSMPVVAPGSLPYNQNFPIYTGLTTNLYSVYPPVALQQHVSSVYPAQYSTLEPAPRLEDSHTYQSQPVPQHPPQAVHPFVGPPPSQVRTPAQMAAALSPETVAPVLDVTADEGIVRMLRASVATSPPRRNVCDVSVRLVAVPST